MERGQVQERGGVGRGGRDGRGRRSVHNKTLLLSHTSPSARSVNVQAALQAVVVPAAGPQQRKEGCTPARSFRLAYHLLRTTVRPSSQRLMRNTSAAQQPARSLGVRVLLQVVVLDEARHLQGDLVALRQRVLQRGQVQPARRMWSVAMHSTARRRALPTPAGTSQPRHSALHTLALPRSPSAAHLADQLHNLVQVVLLLQDLASRLARRNEAGVEAVVEGLQRLDVPARESRPAKKLVGSRGQGKP